MQRTSEVQEGGRMEPPKKRAVYPALPAGLRPYVGGLRAVPVHELGQVTRESSQAADSACQGMDGEEETHRQQVKRVRKIARKVKSKRTGAVEHGVCHFVYSHDVHHHILLSWTNVAQGAAEQNNLPRTP
uniref:Uncharacterized protein n=1 Tax=Eutreptiella gymnastica TaxID=73025 RepID=A0A7S1NMU6_9EUGL